MASGLTLQYRFTEELLQEYVAAQTTRVNIWDDNITLQTS